MEEKNGEKAFIKHNQTLGSLQQIQAHTTLIVVTTIDME